MDNINSLKKNKLDIIKMKESYDLLKNKMLLLQNNLETSYIDILLLQIKIEKLLLKYKKN